MSKGIQFPIRLKILVTLVSLISIVVGVITFTMANSFHRDKTTYIHDLTSVMALHTAEETRALFEGYRARLRMYYLVLADRQVTDAQKAGKIRALFADFSDFVAVTVYDENGKAESTVYDESILSEANLTKEDFYAFRDAVTFSVDDVKEGEFTVSRVDIGGVFPGVNLLVAEKGPNPNGMMLISAVLRLDSLERLTARSNIFETFIVDASGNPLAHVNPRGEALLSRIGYIDEVMKELRSFNAGITKEYPVFDEPMIGGFATTDFGGVVAGVQIPKRAAYVTSRQIMRSMIFTSLALLISSALIALVLSRLLTRPIENLSSAALAVGKGQFDVKVKVDSRDEIGLLGGSFNQMASELKSRDRALANAQKAVIQSEKMAAFGTLGAGIAHEVKNPLAGILGCTQLSLMTVEKETEIEKNLRLIEKETRRCKDIIESLLKFARQEKSESQPTELDKVVADAYAILRHQMEVHEITLRTRVEENLPAILGNPNQLQQVLVNLVINAQQAMGDKGGEIEIAARKRGQKVTLEVSDTGPGIPHEIKERIFDPFFTTKRGKKGTGLGLSVSYGIVRDHEGTIKVESELGKGTQFIMTFHEIEPRQNHKNAA